MSAPEQLLKSREERAATEDPAPSGGEHPLDDLVPEGLDLILERRHPVDQARGVDLALPLSELAKTALQDDFHPFHCLCQRRNFAVQLDRVFLAHGGNERSVHSVFVAGKRLCCFHGANTAPTSATAQAD